MVEVLQEATDIEEKLKKLVDCATFMFEKTKCLSTQNKSLLLKLE